MTVQARKRHFMERLNQSMSRAGWMGYNHGGNYAFQMHNVKRVIEQDKI